MKESVLTKDDIAAWVRAAGLKLTPQRLAIVRELVRDPTHPTAQELFERLRPSMPSMSFATVYNTLDALASRGLCSVRAMSPGPSRFDPNMASHDHVVCDGCGLVRDVPAVEREGRNAPVRSERARRPAPAKKSLPSGAANGFVVRSVEQIYRGLCAECARVATPKPSASPRRIEGPSRPRA